MEGISPWRNIKGDCPVPFSQVHLSGLFPPSVEEVVAIFNEEDLDEREQHRDSDWFGRYKGRNVLYDCPTVKRVTVVSYWGVGKVHAKTLSRAGRFLRRSAWQAWDSSKVGSVLIGTWDEWNQIM